MLTIQEATAADLEGLAELLEELTNRPTDYSKMADNFTIMKSNPDYILLIAREDDLVVGSVMGIICLDLAGECRPFMVIENVIVRNSRQGKGIGAMLMAELETMGRERQCYYAMLVSSGHRKAAHRFYRSVGYDLDAVQGFKKYL